MTSNYFTIEDLLKSIRPLTNNGSGSLGEQHTSDLPRSVSSAYQKHIDTVTVIQERLLKNGKEIIANRLLPYLRSYELVAELVSLWETATLPCKEFQINVAKSEHNNRFKRIEELIEDFKTSLETVGKRTDELGTLLVEMSLSEIETAAFEKLAMKFNLQCGNITAELGMCLKNITYLKEELKEGSAPIKKLVEQRSSDTKYSVMVTGVLAFIGILLLYLIGNSYLTMGFCSAAVISGIRSRKLKHETSEYCMLATRKYEDYERRLPLLQDKHNNLLDSMSRVKDIKNIVASQREYQRQVEQDRKEQAHKDLYGWLEPAMKEQTSNTIFTTIEQKVNSLYERFRCKS